MASHCSQSHVKLVVAQKTTNWYLVGTILITTIIIIVVGVEDPFVICAHFYYVQSPQFELSSRSTTARQTMMPMSWYYSQTRSHII